jgi:hypothetical protein
MQKQNISITALGDGGMAFGYAADGQGVYVPKAVAAAAKVQPYGVYLATLVPNRYRPEKTELMAVHVQSTPITFAAVDAPQQPAGRAAETAREFRELTPGQIATEALDLVRSGGAWSAAELIEEICGEGWRNRFPNISAYVSVYLHKAFQDDELSRSEIFQHPGQSRPSLVRWSADWTEL